jgi:hypothetical protein
MNKTNTAFIKEVSAFVAPHSYNMHPIMACDASLQLNKRSFWARLEKPCFPPPQTPFKTGAVSERF